MVLNAENLGPTGHVSNQKDTRFRKPCDQMPDLETRARVFETNSFERNFRNMFRSNNVVKEFQELNYPTNGTFTRVVGTGGLQKESLFNTTLSIARLSTCQPQMT